MVAITRVLPQLAAVDDSAVKQLLPLVYEGLRQLAAAGRHRPRAAAAAESRQSAFWGLATEEESRQSAI